MQNGSVVLTSAENIVAGNNSTAGTWNHGAQGVLIIDATSYSSTTINLQVLNHSGTWVNVNSGSLTVNKVAPFSLPAGQYRMNVVGSGTVTALTAVLCPTP